MSPRSPEKYPFYPTIFLKKRDLWNFRREWPIHYPTETKGLIRERRAQRAIWGESKSEGTSHDLHENKCRKNVASLLSHDLIENRGSYISYPTMFLKTNWVSTFAQEKIIP